MYIQHFGLAQYPFSLTPNTRFFLKLPSHQEAFEGLVRALEDSGQFAKITGEVGTGKTMLCRKLLNALAAHKATYVTAYIPHPILSEEGIMHAIAGELGLEHESLNYRELLKRISSELLRLGNLDMRVALFIDEAQALPEESLKAISLLTRVEAKPGRHLKVVLFGQPELETLLQQPSLAMLEEHFCFDYHLPAMDRDGTEAYIQHRLAKAGYSGPHMFANKAIDLIYSASGGVPRLINILCHKALMVAYGKGETRIHEDFVTAAIEDTETASKAPNWRQRLFGSKPAARK
ncbi:MAG: AAA family ATPase [Pseudomonadales bacterium]|jgi:MSHA biogenesis protein MshM|nr:AAA family ATPase [Pseudomonadales bacterium]